MTEGQVWIQIAVDVAVAVGTILLAIVAVFGDKIRTWLAAPKLSLELADPLGVRTELGSGSSDTIPTFYYHLRVTNKRRWSRAHNVRVLLVKVGRPAADGSINLRPLSGGVQLTWQHGHSKPQFATVGYDEICDLCRVEKVGVFRVAMLYVPNNLKFLWELKPGGRVQVEVLAVSDEVESPPVRFDISWDGEWSEDAIEMQGHFVVKKVES